ncbi:hypothetical protein [Solitalea canadensis]|uniref:hypothetical protein n=1 Tax=Solitalea canadensis TaxID=995 RepID=UPI0012FB27B7|nr:hypothetical protein [Solitalea canadensis]
MKKEQLLTLLKLGKPVEQWIGFVDEKEYTVLKWLRIDKERNGEYSVSYFEVYDEGNIDFLDIYEFSSFDPDEPYGLISTFSAYEEALNYCLTQYGCSYEGFINGGMIQEEYKKYLDQNI